MIKMSWKKILKIDINNINFRKAQYLVTLIRYLVDMKGMRNEEEFKEFMGRELTQKEKEMFKVTVENYDEVNRKDTYTFKDIHYTDLQHPLNIYRVFFGKFPTVREVETILERPMTEKERQDYKSLSEKYDENYRERKG
jgi:hypothetical protein